MAENGSPQVNILAMMQAQQATNESTYLLIREMRDMLSKGVNISQSSLNDRMPGKQIHEPDRDKWEPKRRGYSNAKQGFTDAFEQGLAEAIIGSDFKKQIIGSINRFATDLGVEIEDLPGYFGNQISQTLADSFKKTKFGADFSKNLTNVSSAMANTVTNVMGDISAAGGTLSAGMPALAEGLGSVAAAAAPLAPQILLIGAALVAVDIALDNLKLAFDPAIEGIKRFNEAVKKASTRTTETAKSNMEYAQKRLVDDINAMVEAPFKVLEDAANKVAASWDNALGVITSAQGYTKSDLQDLMSVYAQRLRAEGLTKVVSGADITDNLTKVLQAGLSGKVAEEFAYLATKLNAAVPTQDFFGYAATYASIAANAIQAGESQQAAIALANKELEQFASNVLYASRQLAGGFSTGLTNASALLESSVKIANASRIGDASQISGVLTSVSAIVGAIAPDLANSMVDTVVSAALGGNSSSYLALRSLAGTGASNTSFLQALARNPQQVFVEMFSNLAKLQSMSSDNFMEVAEGLSGVFGVSMDALSRVDFAYLAKAVGEMNEHNNALEENMSLLVSGQTTSTAEQLRMEKINQYMIEEGLSYILDNEVARSIQEHMWQEQMKRELQETTYGVELVGATQQMLAGIFETVKNIINFLNPFSWVKKVTNVLQSANEGLAMKADIVRLLEAGNIGNTNARVLAQLTTSNRDLGLTKSYLSLLNGTSSYEAKRDKWRDYNDITRWGVGGIIANKLIPALMDALSPQEANAATGVASRYSWSTVGKQSVRQIFDNPTPGSDTPYQLLSATSQIAARSSSKFNAFIQSMDKFIEKNKTYDEWAASAKRYGISDLASALQDNGLTEVELQSAFTAKEAKQASIYQHEREVTEDLFWETGTNFWAVVHPEWESKMIELHEILNELAEEQLIQLQKANKQLTDFYDQWVDYYVNHTAYSRETLNAYDVAAIRNAERSESGDAVLALANALTSNMVDLKDPAVQQNVLLSKILLTVQAIMQQNNQAATVSLPTTLAGLGLNITG